MPGTNASYLVNGWREAIQAHFEHLDEKEFPQAKNANPREFFDSSFVDNLESSGFFTRIGFVRAQ